MKCKAQGMIGAWLMEVFHMVMKNCACGCVLSLLVLDATMVPIVFQTMKDITLWFRQPSDGVHTI